MEINLSNYQAYFLDYCEGNLNAAQIAGLKIFLKEHPELQAELDEFEIITVEPEINSVFDQKNMLKRQIITAVPPLNDYNYKEYFVYEIDGELSDKESNAVKMFLETNPQLCSEFKAFQQTVLSSDIEIIEFPDKNSLKRTVFATKYKHSLAWSLSIAASMLIIFGLSVIFAEKKADRVAKMASKISNSTSLDAIAYLNKDLYNNSKVEIIDNKIFSPIKTNKGNNKIEFLPLKQIQYIDNKASFEMAYLAIPDKIKENKVVIVSNFIDLVQTEPVTEQSFGNMAWQKLAHIFQKDKATDSLQQKVDVWDFANAGVVGLNKITENEFQLLKQRNQDGELVGVKFVGKNFAISKKVRNRK